MSRNFKIQHLSWKTLSISAWDRRGQESMGESVAHQCLKPALRCPGDHLTYALNAVYNNIHLWQNDVQLRQMFNQKGSKLQCIVQSWVHILNINVKSSTEISIDIAVWVPHDVICIPDVVVNVECKAGDWTRQWLQWYWKDMWKVIGDEWTRQWNIGWTESRHVTSSVTMLLVTRIKNNTVIINHCKNKPHKNYCKIPSNSFKNQISWFQQLLKDQKPTKLESLLCSAVLCKCLFDKQSNIVPNSVLQADSAFHPFRVNKWEVSCNKVSATTINGGVIWWMLTR